MFLWQEDTALTNRQVFCDEEPATDVWNTHAEALSHILRLRGNLLQFTDPETGGIARSAYYITVRSHVQGSQQHSIITTFRPTET